jgi:iron complex outermembrane recepter protein
VAGSLSKELFMKVPAVLVFALLALAPSAWAQEIPITGLVTTQDDGAAVSGATVAVDALHVSAVTGADGRYQLRLPADAARGTVDIRVSAIGMRTASKTITVSPTGQSEDFTLGLTFHEEITVGSRAPGAESEKAVPVDVLTAKQIATTGASETNAILEALAPSFNFPRPTLADGADTVRPATLRGLGPDQVLVLVNGKRRHQSAHIVTSSVIGRGTTGVDLNAIPASAIERIEVLRDGAAAQYGSDAIAGVINFVLKAGAHPFTLTGKGGLTQGSYADLTGAQVDHDDGALTEGGASYGWTMGRGSVFAAAEYRNRNGTNRATPDLRDQIRPGDGGQNAVGQPNHHWGDSEERDMLSFVNASFPLGGGDAATLYAFGGASRRDGSHGGFYRRALDARNWPQIYPEGFLPTIQPDVLDASGTVGLRGVVAGSWFYDVSAQYGHNRFDFNVVNSLNTSLGPTNRQRDFDSGGLAFDQLVANADVSRAVDAGLASPINIAFGGEFRRESFEIRAGEPNSYLDGGVPDQFGGRAPAGAQVFPGFRPSNAVDASRDSFAGYLDLEADVHKRVRVGLAGRAEHYSDFGGTANGKVTLRLEATRRFLVRGAASTGFRAPSLAQSHFSTVSTNFITVNGAVTPVEVGTFAVDSAVARVLGATDLRPEESVHFSAGLVWSPVDAFTLTADVYRIDIDDRIVFSGNFTGPRIQPIIQPFGASGARFFTNAIDTRTRGLDVTATYRQRHLTLQAAYNRNDTDLTGTIATPPVLAGLENVLFDREQAQRVTCAQPRDNVRLTGEWSSGGFGALVRGSRYGEYCFPTNVVANDQTFGAKFLTDVELSYTRDHATLGLGVQNLFDVFPDHLLNANSSFLVQTYPAISPFGFNGRFLYGRMSYRF